MQTSGPQTSVQSSWKFVLVVVFEMGDTMVMKKIVPAYCSLRRRLLDKLRRLNKADQRIQNDMALDWDADGEHQRG